MISRSRRDSVGGGGVVAEFVRDLQLRNYFVFLPNIQLYPWVGTHILLNALLHF